MANSQIEPWNNLWAGLSQGMANSHMEPWNNLWADLSLGMANSQMEPWNNLWADLSQGMANSQMKPWNNLWTDLSEGMAYSQMEPWNNLCSDLKGMANSRNWNPNGFFFKDLQSFDSSIAPFEIFSSTSRIARLSYLILVGDNWRSNCF